MGCLLKIYQNKLRIKNRPTVAKDNTPQMRFKQQTNGLAERTIMPLWPTTVNTLKMKMIC